MKKVITCDSPLDAFNCLKNLKVAKFDESVDIVVQISTRSLKSAGAIKGYVQLPYKTGQNKNITLFANNPGINKESGINVINQAELTKGIKSILKKIKLFLV